MFNILKTSIETITRIYSDSGMVVKAKETLNHRLRIDN
jgi:hypothetical protein